MIAATAPRSPLSLLRPSPFSALSSSPNSLPLSQILLCNRRQSRAFPIPRQLHSIPPHGSSGGRRFSAICSAEDREDGSRAGERSGGGGVTKAAEWAASFFGSSGAAAPERILRLISGATSSPICQFIESPRTFLHSIDPRIKLVWLLVLVVLPARSHIYMRFGLVSFLTFLSVWVLPTRVWMDQLGRVALLSGILFIMIGFGSDAAPSLSQLRTPPSSITGLQNIPSSLWGYSYIIMKLGPLQFTRKGLSVASTSACLSFTIFQTASLCLTTTPPEQLAFALRWFMSPLTHIGVPVAEIILTLLLSLRFISLVFDEVRNAALGIVARRVCWNQLTMLETLDVFFLYIRRIFKNIFNHAEQISKAMVARGFCGDSETHKIYLFSQSSLGIADFLSIFCLFGLIGASVLSDSLLV